MQNKDPLPCRIDAQYRWGRLAGGGDAGFDVGAAAADLGDHQACGSLSSRHGNRHANRRRRDAPLHLRRGGAACKAARPGITEAGDQARRPRRHSRLEYVPPFRTLLRDLRDRRGLPYDQPPAVR